MDRYQRRVLKLRNHVLSQETKETDITGKPTKTDEYDSNTIAYDDVTRADITKLLDNKRIAYNSKNTKQELYDLLLGSD